MNTPDIFNEDYFERGAKKGISGYNDYSYIPTRSLAEAAEIIKRVEFNTHNRVLDFGAAKGFMVNAMNLLGKDAYGVDISEYAVANCLPQVKDRMKLIKTEADIPFDWMLDLVIAKDVLEHMTEGQILQALKRFITACKTIFIVVPLADNNTFRIPAYEVDITHITKKNEEWWLNIIASAGFTIKSFSYEFGAIKTKWKESEFGNAYIIAEKKQLIR